MQQPNRSLFEKGLVEKQKPNKKQPFFFGLFGNNEETNEAVQDEVKVSDSSDDLALQEAADGETKQEVRSRVEQHNEVLFSEDEAGLEIEMDGAAIVPSALSDDPYWDENVKESQSKEKLCCSFLFN